MFHTRAVPVALCTCADVDGVLGRGLNGCWSNLVFARAVEVSKKMLLLSCMFVKGH